MGDGRCGGLSAETLMAAGWERREEAPEWTGGTLTVFGRRVCAREPLVLPEIVEDGAVFFVVAKVDVDAFDAHVETSEGLTYQRAIMEETAVIWSDRQNIFTWVPTFMSGGLLFRGPHDLVKVGISVRVCASAACRVYVIAEAEYKGRVPRDGGFVKSLPAAEWRTEVHFTQNEEALAKIQGETRACSHAVTPTVTCTAKMLTKQIVQVCRVTWNVQH